MDHLPSDLDHEENPDQQELSVEDFINQASRLSEWDRALPVLEKAVSLARQQDDDRCVAQSLLQLATVEWRLSHFSDALLHANEALTGFRELGSPSDEAWTLRLLGNIYGVQGQYSAAAEYLQCAAALSRTAGDHVCLASCLNNLGIIANELGDYSNALEFFLEALTAYAPADEHIPSTLNNIASLYRQMGQQEHALEYHSQTLEFVRERAGHVLLATFLHNTAETLRQLNREAEALPLLEESLKLARHLGDHLTEMLALDSLGLVAQSLGDVPLALEHYEQGLRLAATVNHPLAQVKLLMHHGALLSNGGQKVLEEALQLTLATKLKAEEREVHDLLSTEYERTGNYESALRHTRQARRVEQELFNEAQSRRAQALQIQYDVAKTREIAENQRILNEQLKRVNEELDAFSYTISHDLRGPVRQIQGFASLLRRLLKADGNSRADRYLDLIEEAIRRLNTLIDALLKLARQSRDPLETKLVDLNALVHEIQEELNAGLEGRRVTWKIESLPLVEVDETLIRQVFVNLLSNALKYSRTREQSFVEIYAEKGDGEWTVHVRDNGVGFDSEQADKLFGVFQRLHTEDEFEGTGIGLATVRRIVIRHGGRVSAVSKLGSGAVFSITLPTSTSMK
ncbi:tetratricopeptide repeat protein [Deinococcus hopiensis]|uniref:histidine kinase n=1 Tax=Deinococcus hopiensis KR-140 TaxID=695939 RepID=A0A1W1UTP0_9DEIO|nr:tetratricopeptide repeat protein [Deinococcus hopiensis]SMB84416.1 Bacteriophytochrome (light-regulated signal transduction histidine kinase) [Deinococcus hopiensis KR-140]